MEHCIWGLLSKKELEFVHVSGFAHKLKGHSLYQLIHQEEVLLAKRDISKFIATNKFGGSITRCRIKDFTMQSNWLIMDIIVYIATKDLLLCFLHQHETISECKVFHKVEAMKNIKENLTQQGQLLSPSLSTSSSLSSTNNSEITEMVHFPYQYFHIMDNRNKSVLLTWPDYYPNENTQDILDDRSLSTKTSCIRCVQPPPRLNTLGQRVQTLKIDYGVLTFVLFCIENSAVIKKRSVPKYQPYPIDPPPPVNMYFSNKQQQYPVKQHQCHSCGTESSPEWRRGPSGHKTLCNACGLRYARSVVRQEKLVRQQQFAMFQSQKTPHHDDRHFYHHPPFPSSSSIYQ